MPRYDTYFLMKEADVIDYVQTKYPGHFDKDAALTVKEIGDGNLNYVFRVVEEKTGKSIIVKQAGEALRISAEMKVSTDRNRIESEILQIQDKYAPGLVPKIYVPSYGEFYEGRWFTSGKEVDVSLELCGQQVNMCDRVIWACDTMPDLVVGVEICEDLWASTPPSVALARAGATVILNLSASDEVVGKAEYRRALVTGQSARLLCGYVYANAGEGESTTDLVFSGHNLIAENGTLLAERRFASGLTDGLSYEFDLLALRIQYTGDYYFRSHKHLLFLFIRKSGTGYLRKARPARTYFAPSFCALKSFTASMSGFSTGMRSMLDAPRKPTDSVCA